MNVDHIKWWTKCKKNRLEKKQLFQSQNVLKKKYLNRKIWKKSTKSQSLRMTFKVPAQGHDVHCPDEFVGDAPA